MTVINNAINTPYPFNRIVTQVFTSSGTYTPTAGMKYCIVECVGGGAGGGASTTTAGGQITSSSGGGGGGYARVLLTSSTVGASQTVTIGIGGTGGIAPAGNGNNGGTTSLGTLCVATGGNGGFGGGVSTAATILIESNSGGSGITGDVKIDGEMGMWGIAISPNKCIAGRGGSSVLGAGSYYGNTSGASVSYAGLNYGSGGSGCGTGGGGNTGGNGGDGSPGVVIINEYIWN